MKRTASLLLLAAALAGCPTGRPLGVFEFRGDACGTSPPPGSEFTLAYTLADLTVPWAPRPEGERLLTAEVTTPQLGLNLTAFETTAPTKGCALAAENPIMAPSGGIYTFRLDCREIGGALVKAGPADAALFTATFSVVRPEWAFAEAGPFGLEDPTIACLGILPCDPAPGVGVPGRACKSG